MLLQQAGTHALALGVCNMPWGSLLYPKKMLDIEIVSVAPRCWGTVALAMSVAFGIQMGSASCITLHKAPQLWFFDDFFCRDNSDSLVGAPHLSHFLNGLCDVDQFRAAQVLSFRGESGVCGVCKEMGSAGNICQVQLTTKTIMWPSSVPFLCAWASSHDLCTLDRADCGMCLHPRRNVPRVVTFRTQDPPLLVKNGTLCRDK